MSDQSAVLLVNRRARRAPGPGMLAAIRRTLARRFRVDERHPQSAEESSEAAREAAGERHDVVIAAGGDGTIGAVAHGLAGTGAPLGILPCGTANDLARELGLPSDPDAAARVIAEGTPRATDLVSVNGRTFCTVGGLGLVSSSTVAVGRLKGRGPRTRRAVEVLGQTIYKLAGVRHIMARDITWTLHLRWRDPDGGEHADEAVVHGLFVTNHRTCGGGLVIPSEGDAHDGVFELALIRPVGRTRLLQALGALSAGRAVPAGTFTVIRATEATIETDREDAFTADGDLLGTGRSFHLAARPDALRIVR